jgi:N-acetylglutamate synthase-like GNAT family acetyltransferase
MEVRDAKSKDLQEIAKIMIQEFSKPPFKEKTVIDPVIKSLKFYLKIGKIFVAIKNKKIIGVVVFKVEQWWEGQVILIEDLTVKEGFKKQEIGKILTDWVERYAIKIKAKAVAFTTNKKSSFVKFYTKEGYKREKNTIFLRKDLN